MPVIRKDEADLVYATKEAKYKAHFAKIEEKTSKGTTNNSMTVIGTIPALLCHYSAR